MERWCFFVLNVVKFFGGLFFLCIFAVRPVVYAPLPVGGLQGVVIKMKG